MQSESIELAGTSETDADGLASAISNAEPRFSFFKYTHNLDGSEQSPVVFIYTCPSGSKVKQRMVYATSKAGLVAAAGSELGLEISKKVREIFL